MAICHKVGFSRQLFYFYFKYRRQESGVCDVATLIHKSQIWLQVREDGRKLPRILPYFSDLLEPIV
jgi:hypothetical protein